jgi:hypothetical protein
MANLERSIWQGNVIGLILSVKKLICLILNFFSEKLTLEKLKKSTNTPYSYIDKQTLSNQQHEFQVTTHFTVRKK